LASTNSQLNQANLLNQKFTNDSEKIREEIDELRKNHQLKLDEIAELRKKFKNH
jgi:hypothetical protein